MKTAFVTAENIISYDKAPIQVLNSVSETEIWRLDYGDSESLDKTVVDFNIVSQLSTADKGWCLVPANHHLKVDSKLVLILVNHGKFTNGMLMSMAKFEIL